MYKTVYRLFKIISDNADILVNFHCSNFDKQFDERLCKSSIIFPNRTRNHMLLSIVLCSLGVGKYASCVVGLTLYSRVFSLYQLSLGRN